MRVSVPRGIFQPCNQAIGATRRRNLQRSSFWALATFAVALTITASAALAQTEPDIVVFAKRQGAAELDSEFELDEDEIAAQQADTIAQLMRRISPLIGGADDQLVLIVNGKRITNPRDIAGFPPEALQRAEVLPREAAARYGYAPEKRVVNLVLKRQFDSWTAEGSFSGPTAGGRDSETVGIQKMVIAGDMRWNIEGKFDRSSNLVQTARNLPPSPDMMLFGDDAEYRTLLPSTASANLNASFVRPIGSASLSLSLHGGRDQSLQWLGLPQASLTLPPNSPFFGTMGDIIYRLLPQAGAMTAQQRRDYVGLSAGIGGQFFGLNATLSVGYNHNETRSRTMRGYDLSEAQVRLYAGDPTLDPLGPIPLGKLLDDRMWSSSDSLNASLALNDAFKLMPAGPSAWTIATTFNWASNSSQLESFASSKYDQTSQQMGDVRLNIALPLTSRRMDVLPFLGDMSLNMSGGAFLGGEAPLRTIIGVGLTWSPAKALNLNIQGNMASDAPSIDQLNAPIVETRNVRIYDFVRAELAEVSQISGGNPSLRRGSSRSWSVGGAVRAFGDQGPFFTFDYRYRNSEGAIGGLPTLTAMVEAAFPDRITRDAGGRLVAVDNRPINLRNDINESLSSAVNAKIMIGPLPTPPPTGSWRGPGSVQLTLSHEWRLRSLLSIREGVPTLDRLKGQGGGESRHIVQVQAEINVRGLGIGLDTRWQSAYRTLAGSDRPTEADLHFSSWLTTDIELRIYPSTLDILGRPTWLANTRFGLRIGNLFDVRRKVSRADDTIPPGYSRNESDPLSRVVRLSVRRRF